VILISPNNENTLRFMRRISEKRISLVGAGLIVIAAAVYVTCATGGRTNRITYRDLKGRVDAGELTPQETKRLDEILNQEVSPCGDDVSLGESLFDPGRCPLAQPAAELVVSMLKQDYNVEEISAAYVARFAAIKGLDIPIDGSPRLGPPNALIRIVVFSDFECPHCAKAAEALAQLVLAYPDRVAVVHKDFPLTSIHATAELAARAGFAAMKQKKFWEMHDTLFSAQGSPLDKQRIATMALGLGLDITAFEKDMASSEATTALQADRNLGEQLGVSGTPTLFMNGRKLDGGVSELDARVREEFLRAAVRERDSSKK
jgi:protein-disulfide isomerase